jgi:hypothetical protein
LSFEDKDKKIALGGFTADELKAAREKAAEEFEKRVDLFRASARGSVLARFNSVPKRLRKSWLDAHDGEISPRKAIKLFCYECYGFSELDAINSCPARGCPLWNRRPTSKKNKEIKNNGSI